MTFISYAQNFEDVTLWRALKNVAQGFYIDVGAWDPDHDSVTRAFSERGWHGVNVEPVTTLHAALCRRRPRDINLLAAAGEARATVEFFEVTGTGLSTADADVAASHAAKGFEIVPRMVEVITLAAICQAHAPSTIHFLKLDCEGGERAALAGADFVRYRPWIVLAEATKPMSSIPQYENWEVLLLDADYRFAWFDGLNRFYVALEHYEHLAPLLAQPPNVFDHFIRASDIAPGPAPVAPTDKLLAATPIFRSIEDRIALAQSCRDCDELPKVPDAGQVQTEPDGTRVQIMHNGLKVLADGYCGAWMTRLITLCRGHHEPQEERLFHQAAALLPRDATMIELGGNWSYYSAWFLQGAPSRRAVVLEPDPANRATGERTMQLNHLQAAFVAGTAGAKAGPPAPFVTERSGTLDLPSYAVSQLMAEHGIAHLDLLHCDTQGAELAVLEGARDLFHASRVGLVFVSTHVHHISGDPLTHRRCLELLRECGAVVEAEHDPYESFSGDGLIVARFGPAPPGWRTVPISLARRGEALFRDLSFDLAEAKDATRTAGTLAERVVAGVFDALLFRGIDRGSMALLADGLRQNGDVSGLLRAVLLSPEFATKRSRFGVEYLHETEIPQSRRLPVMPANGAFTCAALHLVLERDGPLGQAGESLVLPNDEVILPVVLIAGAWNQQQIVFLTERLDAGRRYVLLDLGANVGLFSRQVLHAFSNIATCHCVEPDPANYQALCQNLGQNRVPNRPGAEIRTYQIALGPEDGQLNFYRDVENCGNRSLHPDAMRDRPFTQSVVPVAAAGPWLEQNLGLEQNLETDGGGGPILWKSDTQGSDEAIVAAAPWPVWRRVEVAIIELWRIRKAGPTPPAFLEKIADMPNRRIGGRSVTVADVADYLAGDDWAHDDLYLWR